MYDYVEGSGPIPCEFMVVGEAPALEECKTGIPFTGPTGREFDNLLRRCVGRQREDTYVTNLFKFPLGEKKKESADTIAWMAQVLQEEVEAVSPRVILTLGGFATRYFLGDWAEIEAVNGVPHVYGKGITVVPSIHPAAMFKPEGQMGGTAILSWVIEAFENAQKVLKGKLAPRGKPVPTKVMQTLEFGVTSNFHKIAVDTETWADGSPYMVTFSTRTPYAVYAYATDASKLGWLKETVEGEGAVTLLHNALFDLPQLEKLDIRPKAWIDTMQMAFLLETLPLGLKALAYRLCGMKLMTYDQVMGYSQSHELVQDLSHVPERIRTEYACGDADATLRVYDAMVQRMYPRMGECLLRDMGIQPMIRAMMKKGMKIDAEYLRDLGAEFEVENMWTLDEIQRDSGISDFNPKSAKQVSELIYKRLHLGKKHRIKKTKWGGTTDVRTLKKLEGEHPLVSQIMQYRARKDLIDKYVNTLPTWVAEGGRIHADISMVRVPQSGRLAASNPNLLAQPVRSKDGRRIRDAYVAEEGYTIVSMDYSQIEMRIMAHVSQDPVMLKVFKDGGDIHTDTAMRTFGIKDPEKVDELKHRYPSKRTGFGVIYRITAMGLSIQLMGEGLMEWNENKCQWLIDSWLREHPGVEEFWKIQDQNTRRQRWVDDMWGRRKLIPEVVSVFPYVRDAGLRKATNVPMQAGAQGIIKEAMGQIWRKGGKIWYEDGLVYPLIQIHDDLTCEVRDDFVDEYIRIVKPIMENVIELSVPITVDAKGGKRWGSQEKIKS